MISSAVSATHTVRLGGTAEAHTYDSPATAIAAPGGARKTVLSPLYEGGTTYGHQGTRPRHEDHDDRPARREDHHDHPRRQPVTAATVDLTAVERDIAAVLVAHGLTGHDTVNVAAYEIEQAGQTAGITVTAYAYTAPAGVPAPRPADDGSPLMALAEQLEAVS